MFCWCCQKLLPGCGGRRTVTQKSVLKYRIFPQPYKLTCSIHPGISPAHSTILSPFQPYLTTPSHHRRYDGKLRPGCERGEAATCDGVPAIYAERLRGKPRASRRPALLFLKSPRKVANTRHELMLSSATGLFRYAGELSLIVFEISFTITRAIHHRVQSFAR